MVELKNNIKTFYAKSQKEWRSWLVKNHSEEKSVWLIIYKKNSGTPSVNYDEAVDEALCFGWIDSKPNKRDEDSFYQFFSKRKATSNWSGVNKKKVDVLIKQGKMTEAGFAMIELAKEKGTWTVLDDVTSLVIPKDLSELLKKNKDAKTYFDLFPPSTKRGILEWIQNAKTEATRTKRISETVELAAKNIRANSYPKPNVT